MTEIIGTIVMVIAILGVLLNNRMDRRCFILWLASNGLSASLHLYAAMYSLAARDIVFFVLAIQGWMQWTRQGRRTARDGREQ